MRRSELRAKRIAVLAGGESGERQVSLRTGQMVLEALQRQGYEAMLVDPNCNLGEQLRHVGAEVVFNALHGGRGEDGTVQGALEMLGLPYTGSRVLASAVTLDKVVTKRLLLAAGVLTPAWVVCDGEADIGACAARAEAELGLPAVVKPVNEGSSLGVHIAGTAEELRTSLEDDITTYGSAFVESFVVGTELTVGILGVGAGRRALPVLELRPKRAFYDYEAKYTAGLTELVVPADVPPDDALRAQALALRAHALCGCRGISRVDMHLDGEGRLWVHEVNSMPGLTQTSDVPAEAMAAGMTYDELIVEVLASAATED